MKKLTHKQIIKLCRDVRRRCNKLSQKERNELLKKGMEILSQIQKKLNVPITTDAHSPQEVFQVGKAVDLIQKRIDLMKNFPN